MASGYMFESEDLLHKSTKIKTQGVSQKIKPGEINFRLALYL